MDQVQQLHELIGSAKRIVAFTGAGISTESGIPDFRSPGGIWTKYQPIYFDDFMSSEEMRREAWRRKFATDETMQKAEPNAGHRALAKLVERGKMTAIITQNVDDLHVRAGTARLVRLHGSIWELRCGRGCGGRWRDEKLSTAMRQCPSCGGVARPAVVWFGEALDRRDLDAALAAIDAFLVNVDDPAHAIPEVDAARLRRLGLTERDALQRILRQRALAAR